MGRLEGKRILVTGGAGGMGNASGTATMPVPSAFLDSADAYFSAHPGDLWVAELAANAAMSLGDYPRAARILDRVDWSDADLEFSLRILKGANESKAGRHEAALRSFDDVRARLEQSMREDPAVVTQLSRISALAMIEALSGNRDVALARIAQADALLPIENDVVDGANQWSQLLFVPAMVGDREGTLRLLRRFLGVRSMTTPHSLWCSPWAAGLRTDPGFRALLSAQGVDVTRDPGGRPVAMPPQRRTGFSRRDRRDARGAHPGAGGVGSAG